MADRTTIEVPVIIDPVGYEEIAERLGKSRNTVLSWKQRYPDFPDPAMHRTGTPLWPFEAIEAFLARHPRLAR